MMDEDEFKENELGDPYPQPLPIGWVEAPLNDLVGSAGLMCDGDWIETKDQDPQGEVRLIQLADIGDGTFRDKSNRYLTVQKANALNCTYLRKDDVLISRMAAPLGRACLMPDLSRICVTAVDVCIFRSGSTDVQPNWIAHAINSPLVRAHIAGKASGTTRTRISSKKLKNLSMLLPPFKEQERIVAKLDELFSDVEAGEKALERAKALVQRYRQSVLMAAVTGELTRDWREKNLARLKAHKKTGADLLADILKRRREAWEAAELAKMRAKGKELRDDSWKARYQEPTAPDTSALPELPEGWVWASMDQLLSLVTSGSRGWKSYYAKAGAIFVRAQNINKDYLNLAKIAFVQLPPLAEGTRTRISLGDVLVTITGANVTKTALVRDMLPEAYVSQHIALCRPASLAIAPYLHCWLIAPQFGRRQLENLAYGAGKPGLNLNNIREVVVALPPIDEQDLLMNEADALLSKATETQRGISNQLRRASALRQSILFAAFSGKLLPQDPADEPASELLTRILAEHDPKSRATADPGCPRVRPTTLASTRPNLFE